MSHASPLTLTVHAQDDAKHALRAWPAARARCLPLEQRRVGGQIAHHQHCLSGTPASSRTSRVFRSTSGKPMM
jgi:hypothetical protein